MGVTRNPEPFELVLTSELLRLGELRRSLRLWLDVARVVEPVRFAVVLATHEAAANSVEHTPPGSSVVVTAAVDERSLTVVVTDSGRWRVPRPGRDVRGRGLSVIAGLVPSLEIRSEPSGTTVRMVHAI